ncbi:MAG: glutamate racemase [Lachnospiraceae bacterium]|nr:glutamate racemase [Lachnospiraceae bacterium]
MREIDKYSPIGIFDSGVGGLTVARELMKQLPNERLIYFGDTARVPYGSKSKETVTKFSKQIVRFLLEQKVKAIVVACNTASAVALNEIEEEIEIPIIGVVRPGARAAAETTKNLKVGVIATEATIHSEIYNQFIKKINDKVEIIGTACPLFVPLAEEGLIEDPVTDEIARRYLEVLKDTGIDTLILGCTHYPLLRSTIQKTMGEEVRLVNPAYETARECKGMLEMCMLLNDKQPELGQKQYQFFVSDEADKFKNFANSILPYGILSAKKINIEEY